MREMSKGRNLVVAAVATLLALHAALGLWAVSGKSNTADELIHVTAGYAYWQLDDYRLHPENGILPQRWATLPALLLRPPFPVLTDNAYWKSSEVQIMGHQFFYETGNDHFPMLMAGRAMISFFSVGTGILIFCWSRRLFGTAAAFVSLVLFVFCPNFLAHGVLVTSDVCMTFFFLAGVGAWWRHLHDGRARWWWLSSLVFGFAWVAKFSALMLLPMFVLLSLVKAWRGGPMTLMGRTFTTGSGKLGAAALSAVGHSLVAAGVIWMFYGFRYSAFNPAFSMCGHFIRPWDVLDLSIGFPGQVLRALAAIHALPEAFLYGFAYVLETTQVRSAFLNGEYSAVGWLTFFPWAFGLKTTLALLIATFIVGGLAVRRWWRNSTIMLDDLYRIAPLATLSVVYWVFSIASHLNIGHRHILPIYPALFIGAGALGAWSFARRGFAVVGVVILLGYQVFEAVRIAPNYLAYFNAIGGGPENGHRHLVDSSLDWGQDLPALKSWLSQNAGGDPVFQSYFGTGKPSYYGINAKQLPFPIGFKIPRPYVRLEAGVYCISATMLAHVYSSVRGPWTLQLEKEYQELRLLEPAFAAYIGDAKQRAELGGETTEAKWRRAWGRHDELRFARLCYYLRVRKPDAVIGYSQFVFRLSDSEVYAATAGTLREWKNLIERTTE